MPKVSVIIPTYNRVEYIARAIDSVLNQTYQDFEIIVIDDGSTDQTKEKLIPYKDKIKYVYQENGGISEARNRGIQESTGKYLAFLDSDDWWLSEKLAEQVNILDTHPTVGIVYSRMPIINEKGETIGMKPSGVSGKNFKELIEVWGDLPTSTVMTRKECFDKTGLFDKFLPPMEDIDMWLRISRFYDLYEIEGKILACYFRHDTQVTANPIKVYEGLIKIYKKILNNYDDVPRQILLKRIVEKHYLVSRVYYNQQMYTASLKNLWKAISQDPLVGKLFFYEKDRALSKMLKIIKPYGFLGICFLKLCIQPVSRSKKI
jgi:glycosyltransferase involved in cell wall biosynthesis